MRATALASLLALSPLGAWAADITPALSDPTPAKGWVVTIGGSVQLGPKYDGARSAGLSFMPSLSWRRVGEPDGFSAPDDGLDLALYETDRFSIGAVGDIRSGRYSGSNNRLFGLRDVPWSIEAGAFVEFWPIEDRLRTRLEVKQGFHGHHGITADFSMDWVERLNGFTFAIGPRLALGDNRFMRRYFGVSPLEATFNRYFIAYSPGGGLKSVGLASSLDYKWSDTWSTTLFGRYDRLAQDAAHSPLVATVGQRHQVTFGLGLNYSFQIGG
ncbi:MULTISPECIES: MipA/OmpV family protein [unclassified Bosea (in: a-proteobacteria)]|uniref:MipA/OmpV family protein n=1 Tax=unclassified Bosea (in: a-proteobacteria) TaxID=2653178 RepID=UPI0009554496|nr:MULTISPECIES: MipA/OmpV family protein [unclassified Bosea (in: a-proteobacteria)]TAJ28413.1 MAG: MipA/OmpV family protein [Bosea sp. (in: a-proteobacteria)]SIR16124.1 outer membrane insertion C-terminal signal [Bosea sp. TND4EK4]